MERIYGVDPGYLSEEEGVLETVNNYDEHELYHLLRALYNTFFYMAHDGVELEEDTLLGLRYLEQLTTKFGVQMEEPAPGKTCCRTKDFAKWYNFWHEHFLGLSEDDYNAYFEAKEAGEDVSKYLPTRKWNEKPMQPTLEPKE